MYMCYHCVKVQRQDSEGLGHEHQAMQPHLQRPRWSGKEKGGRGGEVRKEEKGERGYLYQVIPPPTYVRLVLSACYNDIDRCMYVSKCTCIITCTLVQWCCVDILPTTSCSHHTPPHFLLPHRAPLTVGVGSVLQLQWIEDSISVRWQVFSGL